LKQDVSTRWNSALYILEQKMALAANAAEISIQQLTSSQLGTALVLSPVKEVTQSISKETVTLFVVIPNIRGHGRYKRMILGFMP